MPSLPYHSSEIKTNNHLKKIVRTDMRVDWSWDKAAAARSQQHIHLAGNRKSHQFSLKSRKCSPGGNIETIAAASEKSMKGKADDEGEAGGDEEVVEVDEEDGVGGQAEQAGGDDEGGQPEAAAEGGEPAQQY